MNKILEKCLLELNKSEPNISYLKGTIETLIEMSGGISQSVPMAKASIVPGIIQTVDLDDDDILNKYENGKIGQIN